MITGHLSQYFSGVAGKRLAQVEANPKKSNQHEFNGVNTLGLILGYGDGSPVRIPARFVYLSDDEDVTEPFNSFATWYDSRRDKDARSPEYRLYYPSSPVMEKAVPGDFLVVARQQDGTLLVLIADAGSTAENQLRLLFGLHGDGARYEVRSEADTDKIELGFIGKLILELIGVEIEETDENFLERMLQLFSGTFPATRIFSKFARSTIPHVTALDDPDSALIAWMEQEETLFRTLERHFVADRLRQGFGDDGGDVDTFIQFSLSVHNRRKSRVGYALENHLEAIFLAFGVRYAREMVTEKTATPDFLFPGAEYHESGFPATLLTMLGVKSTCKDRWRQVLAEADRIDRKHLLTLEPGISRNQTDEMQAKGVLLVLPSGIHSSYDSFQRPWLHSVGDFIQTVQKREDTARSGGLLLPETLLQVPKKSRPKKPKTP